MRLLRSSLLLAFALLLGLPGTALAGGGGHVRAILSLDPASPRAGQTVNARLQYAMGTQAPERATIYLIRPDAKTFDVTLERVAPDALVGAFYVDRAGRWTAGSSGMTSLAFEVSGDGSIVPQALPARSEVFPAGVFAGLLLAPYAIVAVLLAVALRGARTARASYA